MPSRVGITAQEVWLTVLDGVPTYNLQGQRLPDAVIDALIEAAEGWLESKLDLLIGLRTIHCVEDQGDPDDDATDDIYRPPLDKPRNWFAGDRHGAVKLPYKPAQKIYSVTVKLYGFGMRELEVPVDRIRMTKDSISVVPGPNGRIFPTHTFIPNVFQLYDGHRIPNGLEIVYQAGLGKRGLKQYPILKTLILMQAAILALGVVNAKLGGAAQKESLKSDGLENTVELQKGDLGPLSGPIKGLKANVNELLDAARAQLRGIPTIWLG